MIPNLMWFGLVVVVLVMAYVVGLLQEMRTATNRIDRRLRLQVQLPEEVILPTTRSDVLRIGQCVL